MDLYSIGKLMHETRLLAAKYRQATGNTLPVTAEIARFDAAQALKLTLSDDLTLGYDALEQQEAGQPSRVLIKGRTLFETSRSTPRLGQIKPDGRWDDIVVVLLDEHYQATEMYRTSAEEVRGLLDSKSTATPKKKKAISVAQFKIIADLVWTKEQGTDVIS